MDNFAELITHQFNATSTYIFRENTSSLKSHVVNQKVKSSMSDIFNVRLQLFFCAFNLWPVFLIGFISLCKSNGEFHVTKSCIRETLNLLTCADSSIDTKTDRNGQKSRFFLNVIFHVSPVMCHMSRVTCHLSLTPTATAADHPPANPPLCTRGCFAKTQKPENCKNGKN